MWQAVSTRVWRLALILFCVLIGIALVSLSIHKQGYFHVKETYIIKKSDTIPIFQQGNYSWFHCLRDYSKSAKRACQFKNICFDWKQHKMIFFRPLGTEHIPLRSESIASSSAPLLTNFSSSQPFFVQTRHFHEQFGITTDITYGSISSQKVALWLDTVILHDVFWPENFGHALGDDFFPIWKIMKRYHITSNNLYIVAPQVTCGSIYQSDENHPKCKNIRKFIPLFSSHEMQLLGAGSFTNLDGLVCASKVFAGTGVLGMNFDYDGTMMEFADFLTSKLHVVVPVMKKQKILVIRKEEHERPQGKRSIANVDELRDYLHSRFEVSVEALNIASMPLQDQIRKLKETTVMITPCGGISFSSIFMPEGSNVIFVCYYEPYIDTSVQIEHEIYGNYHRFIQWWYPIDKTEAIEIPGVNNFLWDVNVSLTKMGAFVEAALQRSEVYFGWQNTYKK